MFVPSWIAIVQRQQQQNTAAAAAADGGGGGGGGDGKPHSNQQTLGLETTRGDSGAMQT